MHFDYTKQPYLDSSVEMKFQYLRSSIPVILKAFGEIDKKTLPVLLSIQISYKNVKKPN